MMIEKSQAYRRKASTLMQRNNETAFAKLDSTKTAGETLQKTLVSVARVSELNCNNIDMADQQRTIPQNISDYIEQMQAIDNENQEHANIIVGRSKELSSMVDQIQKQLSVYKV
jgi:methyl-accepting chemotaxis protein